MHLGLRGRNEIDKKLFEASHSKATLPLTLAVSKPPTQINKSGGDP
jgi:hypothetical protein